MVLAMLSATKLLLTPAGSGDSAGAASPGQQLCKAHAPCLGTKLQTTGYMDNHRITWVGRGRRLKIDQVASGFAHQEWTLILAGVHCGGTLLFC